MRSDMYNWLGMQEFTLVVLSFLCNTIYQVRNRDVFIQFYGIHECNIGLSVVGTLVC